MREAIAAHAEFCHPEEACGLLAADTEGRLRMAYSLTNVLASPTNYTLDPKEHLAVTRHADRNGWEVAGVFHSHPASGAYPSATDIRLAADPTWFYLIYGMTDRDRPVLRCFRITGSAVDEEPLEP